MQISINSLSFVSKRVSRIKEENCFDFHRLQNREYFENTFFLPLFPIYVIISIFFNRIFTFSSFWYINFYLHISRKIIILTFFSNSPYFWPNISNVSRFLSIFYNFSRYSGSRHFLPIFFKYFDIFNFSNIAPIFSMHRIFFLGRLKIFSISNFLDIFSMFQYLEISIYLYVLF